MSKIEKTLELNITHELLALADSFWWFVQPISLKRYWRPHWRFPLIALPKCFATGLHINLEGKTGGGFDVCLHSPKNFQNSNPRLLFMQFKAGVEQQFNSNSKSVFFGNATKPNIHVEYDINSNAKKDQHRLLQQLATSAGNGNAAVYVFPRIVNQKQLEDNLGSLLTKTSFISITEIDSKAFANGVTIDDGNAHKFRTCYNDYNKNEVNFFFLFFGKQESPGGVLGEIFAIRVYRALQALQQIQLKELPISKYHLMDAIIRHVLNVAKYFSVSFSYLIEIFQPFKELSYRLSYIYDYEDMPVDVFEVPQERNQISFDIFMDIHKSLFIFYTWLENIQNFADSEIPKPPANFTAELPNNGLRFNLENIDANYNLNPSNFEEIGYTLF